MKGKEEYINYKKNRNNIVQEYNVFKSYKFLVYQSKKYDVPFQGWKIHISAFFDNYKEILEKTAGYCINNNLSFKWIYRFKDFQENLSKSADRRISGKFITIYPENEKNFKKIIKELYEILKEYKACDIITDRRYKNSIIQYRYGSNIKPYILGLNNEKILDREYSYYYEPYFVKDPFNNSTKIFDKIILNNKYEVLEVIFSSNSNSVYIGKNIETNEKVIIKEIREYLGLSKDYTYKSFKEKEKQNLKLLNYDYFPKYIDDFEEIECYYLITSFFEGITLGEELNKNSLIYIRTYEREKIKKFEEKIIDLFEQCKRIIEDINLKGYYLNDISSSNFFISNKGMKFIDLEFIEKEEEMKKLKYDIIKEKIFEIDNKYIKKSDEIKLSYVFLKSITNFNDLKGNPETKIKIMNRMFLDYKFSDEFINKIFGNIKKYNINLYNKIFLEDIKVKRNLKVIKKNNLIKNKILLKKIKKNENNLNKYIDEFYFILQTQRKDKKIIFKLYNKLLSIYNLNEIKYNYVKLSLIFLECYKILKLKELDYKFYDVINKFLEYVVEKNGYLVFDYIDGKFSVNFKHGNAGLISINSLYKRLFKKNLIDIEKFLDILKYSYTNKISFDYGILGIIKSLEDIYRETQNKDIKLLLENKYEILNILLLDDYYISKIELVEVYDYKSNYRYYISKLKEEGNHEFI